LSLSFLFVCYTLFKIFSIIVMALVEEVGLVIKGSVGGLLPCMKLGLGGTPSSFSSFLISKVWNRSVTDNSF
jgi:hypothetical protein